MEKEEAKAINRTLGNIYGICSLLEDSIETGIVSNKPIPDIALYNEKELSPIDQLHKEVSSCTKCLLNQKRHNVVFGEGKTDIPTLMLVGEGPGFYEDETGHPFVGAAGQYLDKWLKSISLKREDIFIANIVKCRPPNNRNPYPEEEKACIGYLIKQIEIIKPRYILCLGKIAGNALANEETNMNGLRNKERIFHEVPFLVTFHPAAVLRNPSYRKPVWDDLKLLASKLGLDVQGRKKKQ